ncbi:hypothetical protein D9M72_552860 [compost metagenome]
MHQAHAASTATRAGLDHQRIADALGFAAQGGVVLFGALIAFDAGHTGFDHGDLRQALAAHQFDGLGAGANEGDAGILASAGKPGVFREETVARMDRIRARAPGSVENGRDVQIRLLHRGRTDVDCFVGHLYMQGIGVGIAEHGDRAIAQRLGRALDAAGDFTAVGDEDFFQSGHGLALWILRCLFGPLREQARSHI